MFFRSLIAIAILVGLSFPAHANETLVRELIDEYNITIRNIERAWEDDRLPDYEDDASAAAYREYEKQQFEFLAEFKASDPEAYLYYLEARLMIGSYMYQELEKTSAAYRIFIEKDMEAYEAVEAAHRLDELRIKDIELMADAAREKREAEARQTLVNGLMAIINKE